MARNKLSKEVEIKFADLQGTSLESLDNSYLNDISTGVNTLTESWRSNLEAFDENLKPEITGTNIYKFIYIDGSQTSVADKLDEMAKAFPLDNETRERLAANLITQACFENKPVRCIPDISKPKVASVCKPVVGPKKIKKLSFFDKLLNKLNYQTDNFKLHEKLDKMKAAIPHLTDKIVKEFDEKEKVRAEAALPEPERAKLAAKAKELKDKNDIIADNKVFIPEIGEKFKNFAKQRAEHMDALVKQSFASIPDKYFIDFVNSQNKSADKQAGKGKAGKGKQGKAKEENDIPAEELTPEQLRKPRNLPGTKIFISRSYPALITCILLRDNHSLENIFDPTYGPEAKAKAGIEAAKLIYAYGTREKKAGAMLAEQKIKDIYVTGGKKILEEKMPSKEELDNFLDTKKAGYLTAIPYFAFDLTQEFKRMDDNYLKNPENLALYAKLDSVAYSNGFCTMRSAVTDPVVDAPKDATERVKQTTKEGNEIRTMNLLGLLNCEKELVFEQADTIGEYVVKNSERIPALEVQRTALYSNFAANHGNDAKKPASFRDIYNNKISAIETDKDNPMLPYVKETCIENKKNFGGDIDKIEERAKLASNIADKMKNNDGKEFSQEQKNAIAVDLMKHDAFIEQTNVAPETIKSFVDKQEFYTKFINQFGKAKEEKIEQKNEIEVNNLDKVKEDPKKEKGIGG